LPSRGGSPSPLLLTRLIVEAGAVDADHLRDPLFLVDSGVIVDVLIFEVDAAALIDFGGGVLLLFEVDSAVTDVPKP